MDHRCSPSPISQLTLVCQVALLATLMINGHYDGLLKCLASQLMVNFIVTRPSSQLMGSGECAECGLLKAGFVIYTLKTWSHVWIFFYV